MPAPIVVGLPNSRSYILTSCTLYNIYYVYRMRSGVDKSDVWHFREQHTNQCDANVRGGEGNNDIPTQYYCVRGQPWYRYIKHNTDVDDFKTEYLQYYYTAADRC